MRFFRKRQTMMATGDVVIFVEPHRLVGIWPMDEKDTAVIQTQVKQGHSGKARLVIDWFEEDDSDG